MADITVYEKRTCSTCRRVAELLEEHGADFDRVEYQQQGISEDRLHELLRLAGLSPAEVVSTREPGAAELLESDLPADELIRVLTRKPELIQRPIVVRGDRALLARPPERVLELLAP
jgi:arsenate reductase